MSGRFDVIPLEQGMVLDERYELVTLLGEGSMAEVWRARDEEGGTVAIKVVAELLAPSTQARERFAREVRAIGLIDHPNVVRLLGHGALEDDRPYLVMEYVDGETLASFLGREPRVPEPWAIWLGVELLGGLAAAHAKGIIHRDLKPANLILARQEQRWVIKILDFGVARVLDIAAEEGAARLTATGTMLGSPRYMPLEVARGAPDVDARSDVFEVGAVLYDALGGRPPFQGQAIGEVIGKIIRHEVTPLAELRADIAPGLVRVIETAMAPRPVDRFESASQMLAALQQL